MCSSFTKEMTTASSKRTVHLTMLTWNLLLLLAINKYAESDTIVSTNCGTVQGRYIDGAFSFRGIPYASPPIKTLRWKPPEVLDRKTGNCWNGTLQANTYGNTCFQISPDDPTRQTLIGSEDCLYLNVLTPDVKPDTLKPVMVWIHGGSLQFANGNWPLYQPTEKLANQTDIVYVGFNYRLHAFGFMALEILANQSQSGASGNYGFMDMIAVLNWVQTNIQNFGGDPNQVTVFGQSSGGTAIFALLASPLCTGLFHKAWLLSASPVLNKTATDAYKDNEVFLRNTQCDDVDCLYTLSSAEVTRAVPWQTYPYWQMTDQGDIPTYGYFDGAIAIVDGVVLTDAPFDAWTKGNMIDVPLLVGSCANEIDFEPTDMTINTWTWNQYFDHVNKTIGTFGDHILNMALMFYPPNQITPEFQLTSMASDIRANCPNDVLSMYAASNFKSPIYRYVVTSWPSVPVHAVGIPFPASYSFHMWDVFAFFGFIPDYITKPTDTDIAWQRNVQNEILSFIRTGKPFTDSWKTYPEVTANFSSTTEVLSAYNPTKCEFWLQNGFFSYSWIN
ncbi:hypothetical protein ACF0H5_008356 [Mactra antiquata]